MHGTSVDESTLGIPGEAQYIQLWGKPVGKHLHEHRQTMHQADCAIIRDCDRVAFLRDDDDEGVIHTVEGTAIQRVDPRELQQLCCWNSTCELPSSTLGCLSQLTSSMHKRTQETSSFFFFLATSCLTQPVLFFSFFISITRLK